MPVIKYSSLPVLSAGNLLIKTLSSVYFLHHHVQVRLIYFVFESVSNISVCVQDVVLALIPERLFWHCMSYFYFALWVNFMSVAVLEICLNGHVTRHARDKKLEMTNAASKYQAGILRWKIPWKNFMGLFIFTIAKTKETGGAACRASICFYVVESLLQASFLPFFSLKIWVKSEGLLRWWS